MRFGQCTFRPNSRVRVGRVEATRNGKAFGTVADGLTRGDPALPEGTLLDVGRSGVGVQIFQPGEG